MWFLYLLSWIGIIVQLSFVILSVAAGLYYIAEVIEEYTVMTCRIIRILILVWNFQNSPTDGRMIQIHEKGADSTNAASVLKDDSVFVTTVCNVLVKFQKLCITMAIYGGMFLFENFPASMLICGIISQIMHLLVLKTFPFFDLTSFPFIGSVAFVIINHYLAFKYFSSVYYPFSEVLAYFTLCLWLIPFSFFVSLSANENILPTVSETSRLTTDESDVVTNYFSRRSKRYGLLSFFNYAKESILPQRVKKAF